MVIDLQSKLEGIEQKGWLAKKKKKALRGQLESNIDDDSLGITFALEGIVDRGRHFDRYFHHRLHLLTNPFLRLRSPPHQIFGCSRKKSLLYECAAFLLPPVTLG
jgi:hypothetical protein